MLDIFIYNLHYVHLKSYIELPVRPQKGTQIRLSVFDNYFREWVKSFSAIQLEHRCCKLFWMPLFQH